MKFAPTTGAKVPNAIESNKIMGTNGATTTLLPGFLEDEPTAVVMLPPAVPSEPEHPRFDRAAVWNLRVRVFVRSLSKARRAEIARRPRFRNQPYLRRIGEYDPEDELP